MYGHGHWTYYLQTCIMHTIINIILIANTMLILLGVIINIIITILMVIEFRLRACFKRIWFGNTILLIEYYNII